MHYVFGSNMFGRASRVGVCLTPFAFIVVFTMMISPEATLLQHLTSLPGNICQRATVLARTLPPRSRHCVFGSNMFCRASRVGRLFDSLRFHYCCYDDDFDRGYIAPTLD